jgi:hypothetical protein
VAGCCECGDEPSGSCATELVTILVTGSYERHTDFRYGMVSHKASHALRPVSDLLRSPSEF